MNITESSKATTAAHSVDQPIAESAEYVGGKSTVKDPSKEAVKATSAGATAPAFDLPDAVLAKNVQAAGPAKEEKANIACEDSSKKDITSKDNTTAPKEDVAKDSKAEDAPVVGDKKVVEEKKDHSPPDAKVDDEKKDSSPRKRTAEEAEVADKKKDGTSSKKVSTDDEKKGVTSSNKSPGSADAAFSSPTRLSSRSVDNQVITPFQDLSPVSKAAVSNLPKTVQRKIQAAAMSAGAKPASNTPSVSNHAVSSTDATPQTGNMGTGHRSMKFATIGKQQVRRLSKKGSILFGRGNSKTAESTLLDGKTSDEASFSQQGDEMSASGKSSCSDITFDSRNSGQSSMAKSIASSTSSKNSKLSKEEAANKKKKTGDANNAAAKEWRAKLTPAQKEKFKSDKAAEVRRVNRFLAQFATRPKYVRGESGLPRGKEMSVETLAVIERVKALKSDLVEHKEAKKYDPYCPKGHITEEEDPTFHDLEGKLHVACEELKRTHPGIYWDQDFETFVEAAIEVDDLPEALSQGRVLCTSYIKTDDGPPTEADFEKAICAEGGSIPAEIKIAVVDDETRDFLKVDKNKNNESLIALSSGIVYKTSIWKCNGLEVHARKKQDSEEYEVFDAEYRLKGQINIVEMKKTASNYVLIGIPTKDKKNFIGSVGRNQIIRAVFEGEPEDPTFSQVDHITHGRGKKHDDRFEHLRWADSDLQRRNKSKSGVVGPIGEWFNKMRNKGEAEEKMSREDDDVMDVDVKANPSSSIKSGDSTKSNGASGKSKGAKKGNMKQAGLMGFFGKKK